MRTLLIVASFGLFLCLGGCGNGSTKADATATATPIASVKGGACHYQDFEKGVLILYEDKDICFSYNPTAVVYQVRVPFVKTVEDYRDQKVIAEAKVDEKTPEHRCEVVWAPAMEVSDNLKQADLWTTGCVPGK